MVNNIVYLEPDCLECVGHYRTCKAQEPDFELLLIIMTALLVTIVGLKVAKLLKDVK